MSPEETSVLTSYGSMLLHNIIFSNMEETILWGVHTALTVAAIIVLWRRGLHTRALKFLFVAMSLLLVMSSSIMAIDWAADIKAIDLFLVKNPDLDLEQRFMLITDEVRSLTPPGNWLAGNPGLMFLVGDLVVLIRGYILWMRSKLFFIIPIFFLFASAVLTIVTRLVDSGAVIISNTKVVNVTGITAIACSIATNAIITGMIAYQAVTHWRAMRAILNTEGVKAARILFYLVEAGVLYFATQVALLTLALLNVTPNSSTDYASSALLSIAYHISVTYPALVILIVSSNRSLGHDSGITGISTLDIGSHISFSDQQVTQDAGITSNGWRSKGSGNIWIAEGHLTGERGVESSDGGHSEGSLKEKS